MLRYLTISLILLSSIIAPDMASASTSTFLSGPITAPSTGFSFIIDTAPTPISSVADTSFTVGGVPVSDYSSTDGYLCCTSLDLTFYTEEQGGGFFRPGGYTGFGIRYFGSQLFSGTPADPTFLAGDFTLDNNFFPNSSTLTITQAATATPEAATWLMLIMGFGVTGLSVRARRRSGQPAAHIAAIA